MLSLVEVKEIKGARWMPWCQGPKKGAVRLRKAPVCCLTSLAGDSRMGKPVRLRRTPSSQHIGRVEASGGSETSQYPEYKKSTEIPLVAASERGRAQTLIA